MGELNVHEYKDVLVPDLSYLDEMLILKTYLTFYV